MQNSLVFSVNLLQIKCVHEKTRQGVIMLKSPISLQLGTNVRYQELAYVTECQVKILNSLGDPGSPCKNRHFSRFMHN